MRVVVPFDARAPKTRLGPVLDAEERDAFARAMLRDVLHALGSLDSAVLDETDRPPTVLATAPVDLDVIPTVRVSVDDRPLTDAVNAVLEDHVGGRAAAGEQTGSGGSRAGGGSGGSGGTRGDDTSTGESVAVVMADLALATPRALERLFRPDADVVLAPGRGGGTNGIVVGHPAFRVDFHGASVRDHRERAAAVGASVAEVDSFRLATDVDEPGDLTEVLLHAPADSAARSWVRGAGFSLDVGDGRVGLRRT